MKKLILASFMTTVFILSCSANAGQQATPTASTKTTSAPANTTKPPLGEVKPIVPTAPKTQAPDADWVAEFDQATALQATIAKETKDAGIDKLQGLLESLSRDLINKIPKGFHYDQNQKQFVSDPTLPTGPTTPDKPADKK